MGIALRILTVIAALATAACSAISDRTGASPSPSPVLDRIRERGEIVIGTSGNQPPLITRDKSGDLIGLEADLARLIAASMGVKHKMVAMPFAELLPALQNGTIDIVMSGMTITPERNMKVAFVGPYFVSGTSVLTKEDKVAEMGEIDRLNDPSTRLAALKGSTSQRIVENLIPKSTLKLVSSYDEGVRMVVDGDVDALVADHLFCILTTLQRSTDRLTTLVRPLTFEPIGIALPPNDPLLTNWMENFFLTLDGTGLLNDLTTHWLEDPSWLEDADPATLRR